MICAREGRRKPESHALVCFRTLVVRVLRQRAATCASDAIARQPVEAAHDLRRIRCALAEMRAMVSMRHVVRFGCCVEHGCRMSGFDWCAR